MVQKNKKIVRSHRAGTHKNRGVVLFVAVTVSALILVIGIGILSIMTKEIMLGSLTKQSRQAFYAADSGIECAMHWDMVNVVANKRIGIGQALYSKSIFPVDAASSSNWNNALQIDGVPFNDSRFNPFCAGQTAMNVLDAYPADRFGLVSPASWAAPTSTIKFVFYPNEADAGIISKPCALVTVMKASDGAVPIPKITTVINSEGLSSCDPSDPRRVSRGIKVNYEI